MKNTHQTHIVKIGNSNGIRIPKDYINALGTKEVVLELVDNTLVITPLETSVPPRSKWSGILAKMKIEPEEELADFDSTLMDGIDDL